MTIGLALFLPFYLILTYKPFKVFLNSKDPHLGSFDYFTKEIKISERHVFSSYFNFVFASKCQAEEDWILLTSALFLFINIIFIVSTGLIGAVFVISYFSLIILSIFLNSNFINEDRVSVETLERFDKIENLNQEERILFKKECKEIINKKGFLNKIDMYQIYSIVNNKYLKRIEKEDIHNNAKGYDSFLKNS